MDEVPEVVDAAINRLVVMGAEAATELGRNLHFWSWKSWLRTWRSPRTRTRTRTRPILLPRLLPSVRIKGCWKPSSAWTKLAGCCGWGILYCRCRWPSTRFLVLCNLLMNDVQWYEQPPDVYDGQPYLKPAGVCDRRILPCCWHWVRREHTAYFYFS